MVFPNLAFDALLFGLLLLAAALDSAFPITHGALSLLVVGGATYWAAQELSDALLRRAGWTQESLATSVALCAGGFLYFLLRNSSDLSLLVLSIGLMMGALMVSISVLASLGAAAKEGSPAPVLGWFATVIAALALGIAGGVLALVLGVDSLALLPLKAGGIGGALVLWKLRESLAPPSPNPHWQELSASNSAAPRATPLATPLAATRAAPFPQRGTLFDRLFPLLVLGFLLAAFANNSARLGLPGVPAIASGLNQNVASSENGEAR